MEFSYSTVQASTTTVISEYVGVVGVAAVHGQWTVEVLARILWLQMYSLCILSSGRWMICFSFHIAQSKLHKKVQQKNNGGQTLIF